MVVICIQTILTATQLSVPKLSTDKHGNLQ
jgi:hypothetical protein